MEHLRLYLNSLTPADQLAYAARCHTSIGYLRKALSIGQRLSEGLCIALDRESGGRVPLESLRSDVDWGYLARRGQIAPAPAHQAQAAINSESEQGVTHA